MKELERKLHEFAAERDWDKYHSPKNLAIGISVEANELLELFMWLTERESAQPSDQQLKRIREEVGDIMIQLVNFCRKLGIDPVECAYEKIEINRQKYPVEKSFGSAKKYDEFGR
jgi:NTP pyrophosphatase (non-canonical NTP hydrolase)